MHICIGLTVGLTYCIRRWLVPTCFFFFLYYKLNHKPTYWNLFVYCLCGSSGYLLFICIYFMFCYIQHYLFPILSGFDSLYIKVNYIMIMTNKVLIDYMVTYLGYTRKLSIRYILDSRTNRIRIARLRRTHLNLGAK